MKKFSRAPVTFAVAVSIAACGPSQYDYTDDSSRRMSRHQYATAADCQRDWKAEECETKQPAGSSRPATFGPYFSGGHYYSSSGEVRPLAAPPNNARPSVPVVTTEMTPSQVYSQPGRYSSGAAQFSATRSSSVAASRGGMVSSSGHSASSGG